MEKSKKTVTFSLLLTYCCLFFVGQTDAMNTNIKDLNFYKETSPYNTFSTRQIKIFNEITIDTKILFCSKSTDLNLPIGLTIKGIYEKKWYAYNLATNRISLAVSRHPVSLCGPKSIYTFPQQFSQQPDLEPLLIVMQLIGSDGKSHLGIMNLSDIYKPESNYKTNGIQTIGKVKMGFGVCSLVWHNNKFWLELKAAIQPKLN